MAQRFKSIYFSDCPGESARERNLTLAFGDKDESLHESVKCLSSQEIRERLGHSTFEDLSSAAQRENLPVNSYCLRRLRDANLGGADDIDLFTELRSAPTPLIDGIQATFRGGQAEPLHDWYPYLEGYSPRFVHQVLEEFAPQSKWVIDPFAGAGTTPISAAISGREAVYCEVNPLLQFLIQTKIEALRLNQLNRQRLVEEMLDLTEKLPNLLKEGREDVTLQHTYEQVFGDSQFFDQHNYIYVLRSRSLVDNIACEQPLLARFFLIAVLSALLPSSRLIRRGDVRFKTPAEMARKKVSFESAVKMQLRILVRDLCVLKPIAVHPKLLCEDARRLGDLLPMEFDTVITSPPYLNGTNYFRNTKLELWFLRCLRQADDLADFRLKAVTAGINDVTNAKLSESVPVPAFEYVQRIAKRAYDIRIPRMIASYFSEMRQIFAGLSKHLLDRATLAVDIGDSAYGNVHVPTDRVLTAIFDELGYRLKREVVLRKRLSRGGLALRQVLLVFEFRKPKLLYMRDSPESGSRSWQYSWGTFKADLPHQHGDFCKRNWGNSLHSLCSYQGKMKPSLAHHLAKTFTPVGGRLLDPFGGVGTIPFEAAINGVTTWSFEISPAAFHIASAKLGEPDPKQCEEVLQRLSVALDESVITDEDRRASDAIRFNGRLADYFAEDTFAEVLRARKYFLKHPPRNPSESLVVACLLHILHGNRPYALSRRSHPITPFAPTGSAEYRPLLPRLRDKVNRSVNVNKGPRFVCGKVFIQDATSWWPREINNLDAIITSPPFFDSTRFYLANWMRLWFCGWEAGDFRVQPLSFIDERQKTGFEVYESIFRQARERLRSGGVMVLHLGKSRKCDMAAELIKVATRWFRVADNFSETVEHCESHGIRDKGTVTAHQFLVLT
jgi:DNA modification methylase